MFRGLLTALALFGGAAGYGWSMVALDSVPRIRAQAELLVSLPLFAQVLLAGGDRHLAANLNGFRVLVAATDKMSEADYAAQARLQEDVAWLNPAHEDNYYIAAAILPWSGEIEAAGRVLRRAADARLADWQPLFYLGFHHYYFLNDPVTGGRLLLEAVPRARDEPDRWALQNVAARWFEQGYDTVTAAGVVDAMAKGAVAGNFRRYLQLRAQRLLDLARLQDAVHAYRGRNGVAPGKLDDLVSDGLIGAIPHDPLGEGYALDDEGIPVFASERRKRR